MTGDKATRSKKSTAPISRDASTILNPNNNVNLSQGESGIVASMLTGISEEQGSSTQNQRRPENSDDIMSNSVSNQGQDSQSSVTSATPKQAQRSLATNKSSKLPATLAKNMTTASNINNQDDSSYITSNKDASSCTIGNSSDKNRDDTQIIHRQLIHNQWRTKQTMKWDERRYKWRDRPERW